VVIAEVINPRPSPRRSSPSPKTASVSARARRIPGAERGGKGHTIKTSERNGASVAIHSSDGGQRLMLIPTREDYSHRINRHPGHRRTRKGGLMVTEENERMGVPNWRSAMTTRQMRS